MENQRNISNGNVTIGESIGTLLVDNWKPSRIPVSSSQIQDLRSIASYSWLQRCPSIWRRRQYPMQVQPDEGGYEDVNRTQFPECRMHPLFLSVKLMNPDFAFESLDVITDRSNLRNLLRWAQGKSMKEFRLDAELLGDSTLVLATFGMGKTYPDGLWRKNLELAHSDLPPGWEDTFGHHRIVTYVFGDVRMLVRFPVDVSDPQPEFDPTRELTLPSTQSLVRLPSQESKSGLRYIRHGKLLFQNAMVELMVRHVSNPVSWDKVWHQLYFSQSQTLLVATHQRGRFTNTKRSFLSRSGELVREVNSSQEALKTVQMILQQMRLFLQQEEMEQKRKLKLAFVFRLEPNDSSINICELMSPSNILID